MPRSIAINVGANTNAPGFRGPVYPDGSFEYLPIPEAEPTTGPVPTYADLDLGFDVPASVADTPVHLDPSFPDVHGRERATYGDPNGLKAGPISRLDPGDFLLFYATLTLHPGPDTVGDPAPPAPADPDPDLPPEWGVYLIGEFRVARAVTGEEYADLPADERAAFAGNAHLKRDPPDMAVLVAGDDASGLYDRAVALSAPDAGATANRLVTELSNDSGKGPWWRRRFWYDADATEALRAAVAERQP